jgi:2-succinyl-5-enolpyruvyl-6-hydroxy-3-cyclohexene-1-carboxylate synthase
MSNYAFQPIINIAQICVAHNITTAVLSAGSRNAPLTIAFVRNPKIKTYTISDERAAAFIAMGMAQSQNKPVILCCTSGSAGLNYAPAVAEAYFQQIPLLVITADRPPEWIDQLDGQTIRQRDLFGKHVKASYELPVDYSHPDAKWHIERIVNEAILTATEFPPAPVHINAPFREPFYPKKDEVIDYEADVRIIKKTLPNSFYTNYIASNVYEPITISFANSEKVLIVGGQDNGFQGIIDNLINNLKIPVINECINNLHNCNNAIKHHDIFLAKPEIQEQLGQLDLLITFGKSVLSKPLKNYLRKYKPKQHWHIQENGQEQITDTFQSLTTIIRLVHFQLFAILQNSKPLPNQPLRENHLNLWKSFDEEVRKKFNSYFRNYDTNKFSELLAVFKILDILPQKTALHLSNSMPVRYANVLGIYPREDQEIEVFCNRGTSGIDGCTSTAVGHAIANPERMHVLITGDVAFFYDRNALWHNYLPNNLRIILLNNHGGGIFKMIDAGTLPEVDEYFVTQQKLNAENTAKDFGLQYNLCSVYLDLERYLPSFFAPSSQAKLLEIETDLQVNYEVWQEFKKMG